MWFATQCQGFIPKTQLRSKGASALEPITILSLGHTLGRDLAEERHLCPLRCVKVYLVRTKHFWKEKSSLFPTKRTSDISENIISVWIRELLHLVHFDTNKIAAALSGRSIHSMAASLAFSGQVEIAPGIQSSSVKCLFETHSAGF